ncbi:hypothetical protein QFZ30_002481 [Arthrobacter pascens]|nr:hypothetical protein [Arthrobacter pascens]
MITATKANRSKPTVQVMYPGTSGTYIRSFGWIMRLRRMKFFPCTRYLVGSSVSGKSCGLFLASVLPCSFCESHPRVNQHVILMSFAVVTK